MYNEEKVPSMHKTKAGWQLKRTAKQADSYNAEYILLVMNVAITLTEKKNIFNCDNNQRY